MPGAGVLLDKGQPQGSVTYPLIVETILHAAGLSVVPMENGAVMIRFPSTNGFVVSVPLSAAGVRELISQLEAAGQSVTPDDTVSG
jgi:hypothetical protein